MKSEPAPDCPLCGSAGTPELSGLEDRLFGAEGSWTMYRCRDARCATEWLNPRPLAADIGEAYREYYTHSDAYLPREGAGRRLAGRLRRHYLASAYGYPDIRPVSRLLQICAAAFHWVPVARSSADFNAMYLPYVPDGAVLDVGCGAGNLLDGLRTLGWQRVVGVDFDSEAVEFARAKGLEVYLGGIEAAGLQPGSLDAVVASHLIEHVYNPGDLLETALTMLKPGGRLTLVTPNVCSVGRSLFGAAWRGLEPPRHLQIFSPAGLADLCRKVGFADIQAVTTVRGAAGLFAESLAIKSAGRRDRKAQVSIAHHLAGRLLQFLEMACLPLAPMRGEELVIKAVKPLRPSS